MTATEVPAAQPARMAVPPLTVRARDVLASEWTKFRSARATSWTLLVAVITPVALSVLVAVTLTSQPKGGPAVDPLLPRLHQPGVRRARRRRAGRAGVQHRV